MHPPRFSIVIACYNQRRFVQAAVKSAIAQPHSSKEIIAVDDGSCDGTAEVLEGFGDSIRLVKFAENQGAVAVRNQASALARGEYLVFLDGDDVFMPWTLQVYERLIETQRPKIILGQRFYFEDEVPRTESVPGRIDFVDYPNWFHKDRMVAFGASNFVVHRQTFWKVGGWSPGIFHLDITDLLLKLGLSGRTLVILSPSTVCYRRHSASTTNSVGATLRCAHVLLKKERAGEYPGGREYLFARSSCLGGPMLFWIRRAVREGPYVEAMKLAGPAAFTILAAIVWRSLAVARGRRRVQSVEMLLEETPI